MRYGKIIGILLVICVAVTFLGVVSAAEVEIGGMDFKIPNGYKEDVDAAKETTDSDGTTYFRSFSDGSGGKYVINVITSSTGTITGTPINDGDEQKVINGIDGLYNREKKEFTFIKDGKLVIISGADENLLKEILDD